MDESTSIKDKIGILMYRCPVFLCTILLLLASCTPIAGQIPAASSTFLVLPTSTRRPTIQATIPSSPQPSATAPLATVTDIPLPRLCSPLQGFELQQLPGLVSNPFQPPAPGSDDPHHGVDLAVRLPNSDVAVSGAPVRAALAGQVAAVVKDRFPYGNALLIETPLENAPAEWQQASEIPTPAPTLEYRSALTCPAAALPPALDFSHRSLYVLYAHLRDPVQLNPGDAVTCGQGIGVVGSSGNALNPHLHLEIRIGPAGMIFPSLAHYDNSATNEEMSSYCLWRISGLFQMIDPLKIMTLPLNK